MFSNRKYLVPFDARAETPVLGNGFEPVQVFRYPPKETAIAFETETSPDYAVGYDWEVVEVLRKTESHSSFVATVNFEDVVKGLGGSEAYESVFRQKSVFLATCEVTKTTQLVRKPRLKFDSASIEMLGRTKWRDKYGTRFVSNMAYGGRLFYVYIFDTRDVNTREKILASLQAAVLSGSAERELRKNGVVTHKVSTVKVFGSESFIAFPIQMEEFLDKLEVWGNSITGSSPTSFWTRHYQEEWGPEHFPLDLRPSIGIGGD